MDLDAAANAIEVSMPAPATPNSWPTTPPGYHAPRAILWQQTTPNSRSTHARTCEITHSSGASKTASAIQAPSNRYLLHARGLGKLLVRMGALPHWLKCPNGLGGDQIHQMSVFYVKMRPRHPKKLRLWCNKTHAKA